MFNSKDAATWAELESSARRAWEDGVTAHPDLDTARDHAALLALAHAVDGLAREGIVDGPALVARGTVAARHLEVVRTWVTELEQRGVLSLAPTGRDRWELTWTRPVPGAAEVDEAWRTAEAVQPEVGCGGALTRFFARASTHLPELLADTAKVQALLFEDDTVVAEIYQTNEASRYTNAAAAAAVRLLAAARPDPLRIWEIGGGVGATTDVVLDAVVDHDLRYHFTDVGRWFLDQALDRWAGRAGLSVGLADLNDPELGSRSSGPPYDVVLAANVLHNALDPAEALSRIAACSSDDAWLLMVETCTEHLPLLVSMRFMMSPPEGSEGFVDDRVGTGRIFLDLPQWRRALAAGGWSVEQVLPGTDSDHPAARYDQHLVVARRTPRDENPA